MPPIAGLVKRAPKWAWVTAAGVGIGGVAVYTVKNRAAPPSDGTTDGSTDTIGDPPTQLWDSSPVPGIVVPPIVTPGGGDTNVGVTDLQNLYIDATGRTLDLLAGGFGALLGGNLDLTHAILDQNPQYPFRGPKGCYQVATANECKCTGTGRTRKCWTVANRWHIGQSGYRDVVSQNKVKDGC
jgi:hypothetical protein